MSYLLQGTSSVVGPTLAHLLGKEVAKYAPCICTRCAHIIAKHPSRGATPTARVASVGISPTCIHISTPSVASSHLLYSQPSQTASDLRNRYQSEKFQRNYFSNFATSLPHLGHPNPVNINMSFKCGPDILGSNISYRFLHTSQPFGAKPSKLEESVTRLKEKHNDAIEELSKIQDLEKKIESVMEEDAKLSEAVKVSVETNKAVTEPKKSLWERFVVECKHYYSGFKLLFLDVNISSKIIYRVCQGQTLSRRENRQLVRTVSDLFRLLPFSVFIMVPFMELLLPLALKMFPGMLPSTFNTQDDREVKMRRALKAKLEYAKFLQQTLDEMGPAGQGHHSNSASDFVKFYETVKTKGATVSNEQILKFSKLFEDEITLDNMTRGQLSAICRLLDLTPFGTNAFLRFQIEIQLRRLKADDIVIKKEGVDSLNVAELQNACKDRGMRALGLTKEKLHQQLKHWIELSTNNKVPPSLLLLSRTLYLPESLDSASQIAATISALPDTAVIGAKAKIGSMEGKIENVTQLEIIKAEQAKIEEEAKDKKKQVEAKTRKDAEEKVKAEKLKQEALESAIEEQALGVVPETPPTAERIVSEATGVLRKATVTSSGTMEHSDISETIPLAVTSDDIHVGQTKVMEIIEESRPPVATSLKAVDDLSTDDLEALRSAIETINTEKGSNYIVENEVLTELKQELSDYQDDLGELSETALKAGRKDLKQSKGAARLFKRVNKMLNKMDGLVQNLEVREKKLGELGTETEEEKGHLVTVQSILQAVRGLQEVPDSARLERISEVVANMDDDIDGVVKVDHVNKVVEILGRDNLHLSTKQVKQVIDLIGKEEMIETESRIESRFEKILGKLPVVEVDTKSDTKSISSGDESDISEKIVSKADEDMKDTAVEMNEIEAEKHIQEMFSRPGAIKVDDDVKASDDVEDHIRDMFAINETAADDIIQKPTKVETEVLELSRPGAVPKVQESVSQVAEDNSVKDVSDIVDNESNKISSQDKEHENEPVKVKQKNGSKH